MSFSEPSPALIGSPRPLAAVFSFEAGLALIGPDCLAGLGGFILSLAPIPDAGSAGSYGASALTGHYLQQWKGLDPGRLPLC